MTASMLLLRVVVLLQLLLLLERPATAEAGDAPRQLNGASEMLPGTQAIRMPTLSPIQVP